MKKKIISILLVTFMSISLTSCSSKDQSTVSVQNTYQKMDEINIDFNVESIDNEYLTLNYPSDDWKYIEQSLDIGVNTPNLVLLSKNPKTQNGTNINIGIHSIHNNIDLETYGKKSVEEVKSFSGFNVELEEIRNLGDNEIYYYEMTLKITDEILDLLLEQGTITKEILEQAGGREAFKTLPETKQIGSIIKNGDKVVTITGTYYDDTEKDGVLKGMKTMIQTLSVK